MKFWKVTTRFFDNGKVDSNMEQIEAATMPDNSSSETKKYDEYIDYFKTKKKAKQWVEDAYSA